MFKFAVILIILSLVAGVLFSSPLFTVEDVVITGYEEEGLDLQTLRGQNIFTADTELITAEIREDPYVEEINYQRVFPDRLEFEVIFNQPLAAIINNEKYVIFNTYNYIIGEDLEENRYQVPVLENLSYNFRGKEVLLAEEVEDFLAAMDRLPEEQKEKIVSIDFAGPQIRLKLEEGAEVVMGGFTDIDRKFNILYSALKQDLVEPENMDYLDLSAPERPVIKKTGNND